MRKIATLTLAAALGLGIGCAPIERQPVSWNPGGGSRADATVTLEVWYNPLQEYVESDASAMQDMASTRCRAWGYERAEVFAAPTERCVRWVDRGMLGNICVEMQGRQIFQCIGQGNATNK